MVRLVPGTDINMEVRALPASVYHQTEKKTKKHKVQRYIRKVLLFLFSQSKKKIVFETFLSYLVTLGETACLSVSQANGNDQDPEGCSK